MRILYPVCSLLVLLSLCACGASYRNISTMNQYEFERVEQIKHSYVKCIVQKSLGLDDGRIDPQLIVDASSRECSAYLSRMAAELKGREFMPVQVDQYVGDAKIEGRRKSLEAILRMRVS